MQKKMTYLGPISCVLQDAAKPLNCGQIWDLIVTSGLDKFSQCKLKTIENGVWSDL
ncbi:MAG: hypothetical protein SPJ83_00880 [Helicobacter sp.]|uniref:hypothetical protein n=1 Tax=Helicobacter sp. TaxID=218 RepID=UPI002A91C6ED|nr:hypothetical protein [Helicobacter sp.]MDY5821342.1 hypothetical protein [Helicobacter sp.]